MLSAVYRVRCRRIYILVYYVMNFRGVVSSSCCAPSLHLASKSFFL